MRAWLLDAAHAELQLRMHTYALWALEAVEASRHGRRQGASFTRGGAERVCCVLGMLHAALPDACL